MLEFEGHWLKKCVIILIKSHYFGRKMPNTYTDILSQIKNGTITDMTEFVENRNI